MGAPLSEYYQSPELVSKMPGHDHSLWKLYTAEGLSNPSMVYNWVYPVMPKEECPYEALAHVFNKYFARTLIGLIPMKVISILGGPLHFLPSQTGPP